MNRFRRIKSGVDGDSYYHEMFLRGMPHLHIRTKRLLSHEKKAPVGSIDESPNFHAMPKLPEIESDSMPSSPGSPSIESDPMTEQKRNHARKNCTYTSNAGQVIKPGNNNIHRNDLHAASLFPFYLSSLEGNSDQKSNTATNTHVSTPTGTSELESTASSRQSLILAQHRLRQLQLDRIARLQSTIEYYQNQRMPKISEARIHGCDNSGVLLRENSPNCFVSAQRSHYPHSLQYDGAGAGPGVGFAYLTSLIPNSSNAPMPQFQTVQNNQFLPSQFASFPYIQMQINRGGDYGRLGGRLASPANPSLYPLSAQKNDQDTTQNGARRQYQRVIAFQSHWREPPYHGNSHDAPSSSDASETNNQRGITEEKA